MIQKDSNILYFNFECKYISSKFHYQSLASSLIFCKKWKILKIGKNQLIFSVLSSHAPYCDTLKKVFNKYFIYIFHNRDLYYSTNFYLESHYGFWSADFEYMSGHSAQELLFTDPDFSTEKKILMHLMSLRFIVNQGSIHLLCTCYPYWIESDSTAIFECNATFKKYSCIAII